MIIPSSSNGFKACEKWEVLWEGLPVSFFFKQNKTTKNQNKKPGLSHLSPGFSFPFPIGSHSWSLGLFLPFPGLTFLCIFFSASIIYEEKNISKRLGNKTGLLSNFDKNFS